MFRKKLHVDRTYMIYKYLKNDFKISNNEQFGIESIVKQLKIRDQQIKVSRLFKVLKLAPMVPQAIEHMERFLENDIHSFFCFIILVSFRAVQLNAKWGLI